MRSAPALTEIEPHSRSFRDCARGRRETCTRPPTLPGDCCCCSLPSPHSVAGRVETAAETGLAITPPGATFPYGNDPEDKNLRIAPTFASLTDLKTAMEVFVLCVKLATVRDEINKR